MGTSGIGVIGVHGKPNSYSTPSNIGHNGTAGARVISLEHCSVVELLGTSIPPGVFTTTVGLPVSPRIFVAAAELELLPGTELG